MHLIYIYNSGYSNLLPNGCLYKYPNILCNHFYFVRCTNTFEEIGCAGNGSSIYKALQLYHQAIKVRSGRRY